MSKSGLIEGLHHDRQSTHSIVAFVRTVAFPDTLDSQQLSVTLRPTAESIVADPKLLKRCVRERFEKLRGFAPLGGYHFVEFVDDLLLGVGLECC